MATRRETQLWKAVRRLGRKALGAGIALVMIAAGRRARALRHLDRSRCVICAVGHNPTRRLMRSTLEWFLAREFTFVSQREVLEAIEGQRELPRRSIWLVFDDGWKGNLHNVLPLLRQHGIPATVAISPAETELEIAWPVLTLEFGRQETSYEYLLTLPNSRRKESCSRLVEETRDWARRPLLSVDEIKMLSSDPLITIENHTYSHACCTRCTPPEFREEVTAASCAIEEWTGRAPTMLFYPFGAYSPELDALLPSCGIRASANSGNRFLDLDRQDGTMAIPRIAFLDDISLAEATCRLLRVWVR